MGGPEGLCANGSRGYPAPGTRRVATVTNTRKSPHLQAPGQAEDRGCGREAKLLYPKGDLEQYPEAEWPEMCGAMKYAVVIERGPMSYGAHVPDLPGCVAVGETKAEVCALIREAIDLYVETLEEDGQPVPAPQAYELIEV